MKLLLLAFLEGFAASAFFFFVIFLIETAIYGLILLTENILRRFK
jgi:hypothetical protein